MLSVFVVDVFLGSVIVFFVSVLTLSQGLFRMGYAETGSPGQECPNLLPIVLV